VSIGELLQLALGTLEGLAASTVFVLVLFIGFCVIVGFTKLKRTGGHVPVVKSLDEQLSHQPFTYLLPSAPRGPVDQLRSPELLESSARK